MDWKLWTLLGVLVIGGGVAAWYSGSQWQQFVTEHECKVVGKQSGSVSTGVGVSSSGDVVTVTTVESDKTGWLCNDGITYWR